MYHTFDVLESLSNLLFLCHLCSFAESVAIFTGAAIQAAIAPFLHLTVLSALVAPFLSTRVISFLPAQVVS
jgi:hypothetical protein